MQTLLCTLLTCLTTLCLPAQAPQAREFSKQEWSTLCQRLRHTLPADAWQPILPRALQPQATTLFVQQGWHDQDNTQSLQFKLQKKQPDFNFATNRAEYRGLLQHEILRDLFRNPEGPERDLSSNQAIDMGKLQGDLFSLALEEEGKPPQAILTVALLHWGTYHTSLRLLHPPTAVDQAKEQMQDILLRLAVVIEAPAKQQEPAVLTLQANSSPLQVSVAGQQYPDLPSFVTGLKNLVKLPILHYLDDGAMRVRRRPVHVVTGNPFNDPQLGQLEKALTEAGFDSVQISSAPEVKVAQKASKAR